MEPAQGTASGLHHDATDAPRRDSKNDDNNQSKSFVWIEEEDVFFVFSATAYRLFFNENNQKS